MGYLKRVWVNGSCFIKDDCINAGEVTVDKTTVACETVRLLHNQGLSKKEIMKRTKLNKEQLASVYAYYGVFK